MRSVGVEENRHANETDATASINFVAVQIWAIIKPPSEEYKRFEKLAKALIAVPKSEIDKREGAYQRKKIAEKKRKAA